MKETVSDHGLGEFRPSAHGSCNTALGETCHKEAVLPAFAIVASACAYERSWRNTDVEKKDATMHSLKRRIQGSWERARILAVIRGRRSASRGT